MKKLMTLHKKELIAQIESDKKLLSSYPPGRLYINQDRQYQKWYIKSSDGSQKYLPKDQRATAEVMAEKEYLSERMKNNIKELKATELYLANHVSSFDAESKYLTPESKYYDLLKHKYSSTERVASEWIQTPFETNEGYKENLNYYSPTGNILRSKSEMMIDIYLNNQGATYRYESKLMLNDGSCTFPDFTIMNKSGRLVYWEHFGKMDDPEYVEGFNKKIALYERNGIYINETLFCTFETLKSPLLPEDIEYIYNKIKR